MWNRIKALVWKEFLQLRRDRLTMAFTLGMPLIQLIIFGLAINYDVKHMPAVVLDVLADMPQVRVVFEHPDAVTPAQLLGGDDHRRLSFAAREAWLCRPGAVVAAPEPAP